MVNARGWMHEIVALLIIVVLLITSMVAIIMLAIEVQRESIYLLSRVQNEWDEVIQ